MENINPWISGFAFKYKKQQISAIQQLKDFEAITFSRLSATAIDININININWTARFNAITIYIKNSHINVFTNIKIHQDKHLLK